MDENQDFVDNGLDNSTDTNSDDVILSKADYEALTQQAQSGEKWKNRYKSVQRKSNESQPVQAQQQTQEIDVNWLKQSIIEEVKFFNTHPEASEFEADIKSFVNDKGLTYEQAYKLVASDKNPTLLVDQQFINQQTANQWAITGTADVGYDLKDMPMEEAVKTLSDEDLDKWTEYQKMKG